MADTLEDFKILLNQPPERGLVYFSGSEITGTLVIKVAEPKYYDMIEVLLQGRGHVKWTVSHVVLHGSYPHQTSTTYSNTYKADETYVNLASAVWNKSQSPGGVLSPGEYSFPFRFLIPPGALSSHEGAPPTAQLLYTARCQESIGWIRYHLRGVIRRRRPYQDHVIETQLTVIQNVDTNIPNIRMPVRAETQQEVGFLCCAKGAVTATLELPRTGYCLGEDIPFRITIENGSGKTVRVRVALVEDVCYFAEGRSKYDPTLSLAEMRSEAIQPHQTTVWVPESDTFKVPITAHTTMDSSLVKRSFTFTAIVQISRSYNRPVLQSPIYIGNVPYRDDVIGPSNPPHVAMTQN